LAGFDADVRKAQAVEAWASAGRDQEALASELAPVAEYLGHADLSTVHRYAHVAGAELDAAAGAIAAKAGLNGSSSPPALTPSAGRG
jgi:integrase